MKRLSAETKEKIKDEFFNSDITQQELANKYNIMQGTILKILSKDIRFKKYKQIKAIKSLLRRKEYQRKYMKNYKRKSTKDNSKEILDCLHRQASMLMSKPRHTISDEQFVYSNLSVYENQNGNLILNPNITVSSSMPKKLNRKVKKLYKIQTY